MHLLKLFGDSGASAFFMARLCRAIFYCVEGNTMNFYQDLYYKLFGAMADAVESLEHGEPIAAQKALVAAMREAEDAAGALDPETVRASLPDWYTRRGGEGRE